MALTVTATTPGATHTSTSASATLVPQLGQTFAVGDMVVIGLAMDNAGSAGSANAFTTATLTGFTPSTEQSGGLFDNGAAAAGVEYHLFAAICTSARVATDTVTFNFSPNVTSKCVLIWKIVSSVGEVPTCISAAPSGAVGSTTATPTITTGSSVLVGGITIGFLAVETNAAVTADADATNGSWSAQITQTANTGTLATSIRAASQSKVQTTASSTQTYNPTLTSADLIVAVAVFGGNGVATPAAIALTTTVPAPTTTGTANTTPAAITRTAVTPAPTVTGTKHAYATPKTIGLGWYDAWTDPTNASTTGLNINRGQSFTGDGSTVQEISFYIGQVLGTATGGTVVVAIYAHSGTFGTNSIATGSALATSDPVNATSLPYTASAGLPLDSPVPFGFSGANRIVLANGTNYVAMVVLTGITGDTLKFNQATGSPGNGVSNLPPSSTANASDYALTVTGSDAAHAATLVPAPTVRGGGTATPTTIALSAVTPDPTASGGAGATDGTATPTAIALAVVTDAPTTSGSSNTTPAAVDLLAVTAPPTATGGGGATPAAIAVYANGSSDAPAYRGVGTTVYWDNSSAARNIANPGGTAAGDLLLMVTSLPAAGATIATPTGWTLDQTVDGTTQGQRYRIYKRIADLSGDDNPTLTPSGLTFGGAAKLVVSGVDQTAPVTFATATNTGTVSGTTLGPSLTALTPSFGVSIALRSNGAGNPWLAADKSTERLNDSANWLSIQIVTQSGTGEIGAVTHNFGSAANRVIMGALVAGVIALPQPTVTGTANTTPAAVALNAVTSAPTAGGDGVSTPAAIALTVVVPAPTVTTTAETTPAAITITVVTTTPTAGGDARAPPAAIDLAAVTPAPTTTGGGTANPTAIALTAVTPAPTTTGTANTAPAAIVLAATTPAPTAQGGVAPPIFQAQSVATSAAATNLTCQPVIPTHAINDILVCQAVNYAPNTAGDLADMTIAAGAQTWTAMGTTAKFGTTPNIDGTIQQWWRRATSAAETDPTVTRTGDTGADTGFQARVYVIRRCITYGDPWDSLSSSGATALTAANGTIPAVTVSGLDRLVAVFFGCMDDQATGGAPSGFSSQVRATFTIGTDGQFWFLYKDDQFVSSSSIASAVDAPVQGGYSFTGVSFKPANPNDGLATPSAITLSAVTAAPTASGQGVTTPAAIALTVVTPAPTATGGTGGTATPTAIALTAVTAAPTVTGTAVVFPAAIALTVTTPAPSVSGSGAGEAAPAAIQLTATLTTPSASGDANTAPAAFTVSATTPAPTATGGTGASTSPAAITLSATTPSPTATGEGTAFPAAIELLVVVPAPTAIGGTDATATPTTIALDVTLSAPTASGAGVATPPAVVLTVVCATPFASGDQIFFPYWGARVG